MSRNMASTGNRRSYMAEQSYGAPRAGRMGGRGNAGPTNQSQDNGKKSLVNIGGGWKKDWGYSCVMTVGGRKYKVLAFQNKFKDGTNPPDLAFSLRAEEVDGEPAEQR